MTILVRSVRFEGRHGVRAAEREQPRPFEVDLEIEGAPDRAGETDDLADTIDYDWLCETAVRIGTGAPCHLLETLAARIVATLCERYPQVDVTVEVRKLNPPCEGHPAFTAVRFKRPSALRKSTVLR